MDVNSAYEKKIERLYGYKGQEHASIVHSEVLTSLYSELLRWAYKMKKIVTIGFWDADSEVCGYIESLENFKIQNIDKYECKPQQGSSYITLDNIKYIWVDERRARDAGVVYSLKEEKNHEK